MGELVGDEIQVLHHLARSLNWINQERERERERDKREREREIEKEKERERDDRSWEEKS